MKYKYEFIKVKLKSGFWTNKPKEDYHSIIQKHADDGWRLVQIFAPATSGYGSSSFFEIVFEKPKE